MGWLVCATRSLATWIDTKRRPTNKINWQLINGEMQTNCHSDNDDRRSYYMCYMARWSWSRSWRWKEDRRSIKLTPFARSLAPFCLRSLWSAMTPLARFSSFTHSASASASPSTFPLPCGRVFPPWIWYLECVESGDPALLHYLWRVSHINYTIHAAAGQKSVKNSRLHCGDDAINRATRSQLSLEMLRPKPKPKPKSKSSSKSQLIRHRGNARPQLLHFALGPRRCCRRREISDETSAL